MHNYFGILTLDVFNNKLEGVLREKRKEILLASVKVPVPDLTQEPYVSGKVRIPFKIINIKKSGLLQNVPPDKIAFYENQ